MNKEILTQFKTQLSKIGLDAQNVQKRDSARASLSIQFIWFYSLALQMYHFRSLCPEIKARKNLQRAITRDQKLVPKIFGID